MGVGRCKSWQPEFGFCMGFVSPVDGLQYNTVRYDSMVRLLEVAQYGSCQYLILDLFFISQRVLS